MGVASTTSLTTASLPAPAIGHSPSEVAASDKFSDSVPRDDVGRHLQPPEERQAMQRADIPGWGADLDHANRPAYPMERMPPRLPHAHAHASGVSACRPHSAA